MLDSVITKGLLFGIVILIILSGPISGSVEVIDNDDFDKKIEELMEFAHMPGLVACIVKNNTTVWSKGYGYADIRILHKKEATNDTVFPVGSISKSVAATAIMQLNETGMIGLDDNISQYLPFDLKNPRYPEVNITARMLLAHQSSIKNISLFITAYCLFVKDHLGWLERYLNKPSSWCDYAPGEDVTYASMDINVLGFVIEEITGQTYAVYCQNNIFKPLDMTNTSFYLSDFDKDQLVRQYVWLKLAYFPIPFIKGTELWFPGGGLRSTILDVSHFLIMHTSGGIYNGVRILSEESVEELHRAQYPDSYDEGHNHGLGWYMKIYPDGDKYGGHSGTHLGTYAVMKMRYSDKVGVMFFYNQHSYILGILKRTPSEEIVAINEIKNALFEKSDEF